MGSKRTALGGVQRQSLWSGCGVKPRATNLADASRDVYRPSLEAAANQRAIRD
jgi:hypothetical protein